MAKTNDLFSHVLGGVTLQEKQVPCNVLRLDQLGAGETFIFTLETMAEPTPHIVTDERNRRNTVVTCLKHGSITNAPNNSRVIRITGNLTWEKV